MKIPQSIIDRFQLKQTGEWNGEAFVNNLLTYKSDLPELKGIRFMEGDFQGNPTKYITLYNKVSKRYMQANPELLEDVPVEKIAKELALKEYSVLGI